MKLAPQTLLTLVAGMIPFLASTEPVQPFIDRHATKAIVNTFFERLQIEAKIVVLFLVSGPNIALSSGNQMIAFMHISNVFLPTTNPASKAYSMLVFGNGIHQFIDVHICLTLCSTARLCRLRLPRLVRCILVDLIGHRTDHTGK